MVNKPAERLVFVALSSVALFNTLEVVITIFLRFKKYRGVYFWSLLLTATGILASATCNLALYFNTHPPAWTLISISALGWWLYVIFQSLVLWSRLHLVLPNPTVLRGLLWMIIFNSIVLIIPTTVLVFLKNMPNARRRYIDGYLDMETIQVTGFFIQELIFSGLYMWKSLQLSRLVMERQKQIILYQVFAMNVGIVLLDFTILVPQYLRQRDIQVMIKSLVYSIKLKFEFAVLSKMADFCTVPHTHRGKLLITEIDTSLKGYSDHDQECGIQHQTPIRPRRPQQDDPR